jgi:hypothetical protein
MNDAAKCSDLLCLALNDAAQLRFEHFEFGERPSFVECMVDTIAGTICFARSGIVTKHGVEEIMLNHLYLKPPSMLKVFCISANNLRL